MTEKKALGLRIGDVRELSFFNKISSEIIENFNSENVEMRISFMVDGFPEDSKLEISLMLEYRYRFADKPYQNFFSLECLTSFFFDNIENNSDKIVLGHQTTFISDGLMTRLLNICIGGLRGYAASKMASLPINLVLPLINPANLISSNKEKIKSEISSQGVKKKKPKK